MGKSGAARAEFNAASAYTQRRKQRKASVAKRLQETRLKCGLKQQDVAERTGINVVTLSGYEIGKNEPNMEALVSLADVYGVTLDYLSCAGRILKHPDMQKQAAPISEVTPKS